MSIVTKKRCPAMVREGVYDPDSQEGINFCVNYCPYECCVVFEEKAITGESNRKRQKNQRKKFARSLHGYGVSVTDIALILRVSEQTVEKYFK